MGGGGGSCINLISSFFAQVPFPRVEFGCRVLTTSWILFPQDLSSTPRHVCKIANWKHPSSVNSKLFLFYLQYLFLMFVLLSLKRPSLNWADHRSIHFFLRSGLQKEMNACKKLLHRGEDNVLCSNEVPA